MTRQRGGWQPTGFGARLKATREQAGLSQRELAERAGAHYMTVSKVERGAIEPAWPLVLALARALGVSVTAFEVGEVELPEVKPPAPRGRPRKPDDGRADTGPGEAWIGMTTQGKLTRPTPT